MSTGVHVAHVALSSGVTLPIAAAATAITSRKIYLNTNKSAIIKAECERRKLNPKLGNGSIAKAGGKALLSGVSMGVLDGS